MLATDGVEEVELTKPVEALRSPGRRWRSYPPKGQSIQAFQHLEKGVQDRFRPGAEKRRAR